MSDRHEQMMEKAAEIEARLAKERDGSILMYEDVELSYFSRRGLEDMFASMARKASCSNLYDLLLQCAQAIIDEHPERDHALSSPGMRCDCQLCHCSRTLRKETT